MGSSWGAVAPTRVGGEPVPFDARPLSVTEAAPGDLVFVRSEPTALGTVIGELDGCAYSHVGVLADDPEPTLLSARTDRQGGLSWPDFGGVRRNSLADLVDRDLCVAPLALPPAIRRVGLDRMATWLETDRGADHDSRSRFSYAKLVVASAALAAIRRRRPLGIDAAEELWEDALEAAEALRWSGRSPAFYCAEAVAAAYGLEFATDALWVRDGEPHPVGVPAHPVAAPVPRPDPVAAGGGPDGEIDLREWFERVPSPREVGAHLGDVWEALTALGFTSRQGLTVARLLGTLWRYDPILADRLVEAARAKLKDPARAAAAIHPPSPPQEETFVAPPFVRGSARRLPTALVTPRLLLSDQIVTSIRPLRL